MSIRVGAVSRRLSRLALRGPGAPVLFAVCVGVLAILALVPSAERHRPAISLILVGIGFTARYALPRHRLAAAAVALVASVRYLMWRLTATLPSDTFADGVLGALLLATELFGFLVVLGGLFQTAVRRERRPVPLDRFAQDQLPHVDVFVPTYDEGIDVLRRTLTGATALAYPRKTIHVLDDGRRPEVAALAEQMGCAYLTRPDNAGAKAGNLNHALARTTGELVAIFDADHVPVRSFLDATVGFFLADPKVALVQTPHHFYNADPFERNLRLAGRVPPEQAWFYHAVQKGSDFWNAAFFCGSCAVLRRSALQAVGGIARETVTEDAHTALRIHAAGWRSVYLDMPLAAGLATERFAWHVAQRARWTRGMLQILRLDNPLFRRGLTLPQRLCYLTSTAHFLYGIPRLVYLLAPAAYLLGGLHPIDASPGDLLVMVVPHLVLGATASAAANGNARHSFWPEVYETAMAPWAAVVACATLLAPRRGKFNVTPKGAPVTTQHLDLPRVLPLLGLLAVAGAAALAVPWRGYAEPERWGDLALAATWDLWNLLLLAAAAAVCLEPSERRRGPRVPARGDVLLFDRGEVAPRATAQLVELGEEGVRARLPAGVVVPAGLDVCVRTAGGEIRVDGVTLAEAHATPAGTEIGLRFPELSPEVRRAVLARMFTEPDLWLHERFPADRPMQAALEVLGTPWRVGMAYLRRRAGDPPRPDGGQPVGAWVVTRCAACGRPAFPGARRCAGCARVVVVPPLPSVAAPRRERLGAAAGAVFVAAALLFGLRVPDAGSHTAPAGLAATEMELARVAGSLRLCAWTGRAADPRLSRDLWVLEGALDPETASPRGAGWEALREALDGLDEAAGALARGEGRARVIERVEAAEEARARGQAAIADRSGPAPGSTTHGTGGAR